MKKLRDLDQAPSYVSYALFSYIEFVETYVSLVAHALVGELREATGDTYRERSPDRLRAGLRCGTPQRMKPLEPN